MGSSSQRRPLGEAVPVLAGGRWGGMVRARAVGGVWRVTAASSGDSHISMLLLYSQPPDENPDQDQAGSVSGRNAWVESRCLSKNCIHVPLCFLL